MIHPDAERWIPFVGGNLGDAERRSLAAHLGSCAVCRQSEAAVRRMLAALQAGPLEEPPLGARERARAAFSAPELPAGLPDWTRSVARRFVRLVSDTLADPHLAFAGTRGATEARRLRFEADDVELDVMVETRGDRRRVTAQLLSGRERLSPIASASYFVSAAHRLAVVGVTDAAGQILCETFEHGPIEILVVQPHQLSRFVIPEVPEHS